MEREGRIAIALAAAVVLVAVGGFWAWNAAQEPAGIAPDFSVTTTGYADGTNGTGMTYNLSDYRGKVVVLDLMAVNCTTCRIVTDEVLKPLEAAYGNRSDFIILSVDTWADPGVPGYIPGGESNETLIELQKKEGTTWSHALDTDQVWRKYSAVSLPKVVVIDPTGLVVMEVAGTPSFGSVDARVQEAFAGEADTVQVLRVGLFGLALVAGVASFFSPCSVGLIPAYMGFLIRGEEASALTRVRRTLLGGALTAAGIVSLYLLFALLFWQLGDLLQPGLRYMGPLAALVLLGLGALMLAGFSWDAMAAKLGMGKVDGRKGFFAFGVGYGLAAFGCTGPIFLPVLFGGFLEGAATGFGVFLVYALSTAAFVMLAAALVAAGHASSLRKLLNQTVLITRISAVLLMAAGGYLLWFYNRAYGSLF